MGSEDDCGGRGEKRGTTRQHLEFGEAGNHADGCQYVGTDETGVVLRRGEVCSPSLYLNQLNRKGVGGGDVGHGGWDSNHHSDYDYGAYRFGYTPDAVQKRKGTFEGCETRIVCLVCVKKEYEPWVCCVT